MCSMTSLWLTYGAFSILWKSLWDSSAGDTVHLDSHHIESPEDTTLYLYLAGAGEENKARAMYRLPYQRNLELILAWEASGE